MGSLKYYCLSTRAKASFEREYSDSIKQRVKGGEEDNVSPTGLPQV